MSVLAWNATPVAHFPSFFLNPVTSAAAALMFSWNFSHTLPREMLGEINKSYVQHMVVHATSIYYVWYLL